MANGYEDHEYPCCMCGTLNYPDEACKRCGVPSDVARGKREMTAEEIIERNLRDDGPRAD